MPEKEPIGVIGVGWVGLVTAACFAELGHEVHARDIVEDKVASLSHGEVPIHEPELPELVTKNAERLHFTTDMDELLEDRKSTRLNSSHTVISYAVFCLKKKKNPTTELYRPRLTVATK